MGRHSPAPRRPLLTSRHLGATLGVLVTIGLGATAGLAATGGLGFSGSSDTPADGGVDRTTVEDGKLKSLEFVPDPTASAAATASPSATVPPPATVTTPLPAPTVAPSATQSASRTSTPTGKPPASSAAASVAPSPSATASASPSTTPSTTSPATQPAASGTWLSGVSGNGDTDGSFGAWRGTPVAIVGTWADADAANQREVYTVTGGSGQFSGPIDIGVGGIVRGESWAAASTGAYDARWRASLTTMAKARAGKGTTYIRFAHEMNGNWYPWSVNAGNRDAFIASWKRYRALQREFFPSAKLVFSVNRESVGSGIDWRTTFPGAGQVDVMSVDYYDQNPAATTQAAWDSAVSAVDGRGAPKGLEAHRLFAASVGLPLAISEWGDKREQGDGTVYVDNMHAFFKAHAGSGAGQVLYDVYFNVGGYDGNYQIYPSSQIPLAAARYRERF